VFCGSWEGIVVAVVVVVLFNGGLEGCFVLLPVETRSLSSSISASLLHLLPLPE